MKKDNRMISDWLEENSNPEIDKFISRNLAITEKVRKALELKGWSKARLAEEMDKNPSEVSKWLSGMHNLTMKSIIKMEIALGIDLMHTSPIKEYEYVVFKYTSNTNELVNENNDYEPTSERQETAIAM